ncbi:RES domain-containing protein [Oceaniglobus trochenteri]|uniref:RES domain-containing protein n=1 Tax=Oceaniglobus trochenteri TaxID=2763260 RepID=UPI001CFFCD6C
MAETLPSSLGAAALSKVAPEIYRLPAGHELLRIWSSDTRYLSGFSQFRFFGPTSSRFDHHLPSSSGAPVIGDRGILYAVEQGSDAAISALAEVFQSSRTIDLTTGKPFLSIFSTTLDLKLLDLTGHWTTRIGASALISSGRREICRGWSRDFYDAYPDIDGIRYRSSMSGGGTIAFALFERGLPAMPASPDVNLSLNDPVLRRTIAQAARLLGFQITP